MFGSDTRAVGRFGCCMVRFYKRLKSSAGRTSHDRGIEQFEMMKGNFINFVLFSLEESYEIGTSYLRLMDYPKQRQRPSGIVST